MVENYDDVDAWTESLFGASLAVGSLETGTAGLHNRLNQILLKVGSGLKAGHNNFIPNNR